MDNIVVGPQEGSTNCSPPNPCIISAETARCAKRFSAGKSFSLRIIRRPFKHSSRRLSRRRDLSYSSETLCTVGSNNEVWIMWTLREFIASGFLVAVALAGLAMLTLVFAYL